MPSAIRHARPVGARRRGRQRFAQVGPAVGRLRGFFDLIRSSEPSDPSRSGSTQHRPNAAQ